MFVGDGHTKLSFNKKDNFYRGKGVQACILQVGAVSNNDMRRQYVLLYKIFDPGNDLFLVHGYIFLFILLTATAIAMVITKKANSLALAGNTELSPSLRKNKL
jgi:hypothetical protein